MRKVQLATLGLAALVAGVVLAACSSTPVHHPAAPVAKATSVAASTPPSTLPYTPGVSPQAEAAQWTWLAQEGIPAAEIPAFLYQPATKSTEFGFDLVRGIDPHTPSAQRDFYVGHAMRYFFAHWYPKEGIVLSTWTATNRRSVWFATLSCMTGYWSNNKFHIARTTSGTVPAGTVVVRPVEVNGQTVWEPHKLTHPENKPGPIWPDWTFFHVNKSTLTYFDEPGPTNACNATTTHSVS